MKPWKSRSREVLLVVFVFSDNYAVLYQSSSGCRSPPSISTLPREKGGYTLSNEGVDACYVGPWDLSNNLGYSVPPKYSEPGFIKALDRVLKVAEDHGKPAGLFCNMDNIKWAIDKGFRYNTVASADDLLIYGAKKAIEAAKS